MVRITTLLILLAGCASVPRAQEDVTPFAARSGQPSDWKAVYKSGVRIVYKLNCDNEANGNDDKGAEALGITVVRLCMSPRTDRFGLWEVLRPIDDATLLRLDWLARQIARYDGEYGRILWHCVNGRERTGLLAGMVGRYARGWTREQAYGYMLSTGYRVPPNLARAWRRWNLWIYKP